MTPQEEERRGLEAQRILDNGIYREAYIAIRDRIVAQLQMADTPDDKRKRLNDLLVALAKVEGYLRNVMQGGTIAATEIERSRTLKERILRRA